MDKKYVLKVLELLHGAPKADIDYKVLIETNYQGLPRHASVEPNYTGLIEKGISLFDVDVPTLLCVQECATLLGYSTEEVMEYINYHKGVVLGKDGALRRYPFYTLVRSEKKGKTIYLGSSALKALMEKKGLDTKGLFVSRIPVFQQSIEQKHNLDYLQNELNYATYRVVLRNGRRNFFISKNPPRLVIHNESKLLEKAVREYYTLLEEKEII